MLHDKMLVSVILSVYYAQIFTVTGLREQANLYDVTTQQFIGPMLLHPNDTLHLNSNYYSRGSQLFFNKTYKPDLFHDLFAFGLHTNVYRSIKHSFAEDQPSFLKKRSSFSENINESNLDKLSQRSEQILFSNEIQMPPMEINKTSSNTISNDVTAESANTSKHMFYATKIPILDLANKLGNILHQSAEKELGVSHLKKQSKKYLQAKENTSKDLDLLSSSLRKRLSDYASLVGIMAAAASNTSKMAHLYSQHTYNPCCLLPDHILMYDQRYGCGVNTELWCDSGYGSGDSIELMRLYSPPPSALTHMFVSNSQLFPELKWQYYMSGRGLHTEFPAHRSAKLDVNSDLSDSLLRCEVIGRHQRVFHATVRPGGRNILILIDTGRATMPRSLEAFRTAGSFILSGIGPADTVSVLSLSDSLTSPPMLHTGGSPCPSILLPGTPEHVARLWEFMEMLTLNRGAYTNHTLGLVRAIMACQQLPGELPVLLVYMTSGAPQQGVAGAVREAMRRAGGRIRLAVLAADVMHFRSREYKSWRHFLRCLAALPDRLRQQQPHACTALSTQPVLTTRPQDDGSSRWGMLLDLNTTDVTATVMRVFQLLGPENMPPLTFPTAAPTTSTSTVTPTPSHSSGGRVTFIGNAPHAVKPDYSSGVVVSPIHWDEDGRGVVVSLSRSVPCTVFCGVVGVDVSLQSVLRDVENHHAASPGTVIAVVLHRDGRVLYHPSFGGIAQWTGPPEPVSLLDLEAGVSSHLLKSVLQQQRGYHAGAPRETELWWQHIGAELGSWVLVLIRHPPLAAGASSTSSSHPALVQSPKLSSSVGYRDTADASVAGDSGETTNSEAAHTSVFADRPPSSLPRHALYHRLDLLPPERARVCRQFAQMATLDAPTVYLSSRAFTIHGRSSLFAPSTVQDEERRIARLMRYLMAREGSLPGARSASQVNTNRSSVSQKPLLVLEDDSISSYYNENYLLELDEAAEEDAYVEMLSPGGVFREDSRESTTERFDEWSAVTYKGGNSKDSHEHSQGSAVKTGKIRKVNNPGLNAWAKADIAALYEVAERWKQSHDDLQGIAQYIIRRFGVMSSGGVVEYPGTLSSPESESNRYDWWLQQTSVDLSGPEHQQQTASRLLPQQQRAGTADDVVLLPPRLDESGAGYVVTMATRVRTEGDRRGDAALGGASAVLAADFTLGYWQRLVLELHPACDTTGLHLTNSGTGVRCFVSDTSGYLLLHPAVPHSPHPIATATPNAHLHITVQEPLLAMTLLDSSNGVGGSILQKLVCGEWWRGRTERRYRFVLTPGQLVTSNTSLHSTGKWCVWYSLTAVPGTNLVLGVVNQTCAAATAFCPCSLVDHLCLNCQFVEGKACECPCECPIKTPERCLVHDNSSSFWEDSYYRQSAQSNHNLNKQPHESSSLSSFPVCPALLPSPHSAPRQLVGLLNELPHCRAVHCHEHDTRDRCLGRPGCEWCSLTALAPPTGLTQPIADDDGKVHSINKWVTDGDESKKVNSSFGEQVWSVLSNPRCVHHHECPGGVQGGVSPYPRGLTPQSHHIESHYNPPQNSVPLAPVIGILLGVLVVAGVAAAYCYHQHQGVVGGSGGIAAVAARPGAYTSTALLSAGHVTTAVEEELGVKCELNAAAAALSPYRMNPVYQRPPAPGGDPSDPGYSTMTPHDDLQQRSFSSSSSHALCLPIASSYTSVHVTHQHGSGCSGSKTRTAADKSRQFLMAGSHSKRSKTSRGLSSEQLEEEDDDDDRESSSTSGIFKGLASSSLLSGDHEPPRLDWSPEEVQQYFGDMDVMRCSQCERNLAKERGGCSRCSGVTEQLLGRCGKCDGTAEECTCRGLAADQVSSLCGRCGRSPDTCCCGGCGRRGSKQRKSGKELRCGGSSSDGIESDLNSDVMLPTGSESCLVVGCDGGNSLSSPKNIGPNRVIVPVTVHMVDSL